MGLLTLDLQEMTKSAFGYTVGREPSGFVASGIAAANGRVNADPYHTPATNELATQRDSTTSITDLYGAALPPDFEGTGLLCLPVFSTVSFQAPAGWTQMRLLDPIVEVSRRKNIVITDIQGGNGTVKEFVSKGDYGVTIRGILASDPTNGQYARRYPTREVQALQQLIDLDQALPVTGRLFQLFGIKNLVIADHAWPPLPGFTNLQAYELRCLSDTPIELHLTQLDGATTLPAFRPDNA